MRLLGTEEGQSVSSLKIVSLQPTNDPAFAFPTEANLFGRNGDVDGVAVAVNEVVHLLHPRLVPRHDPAKDRGLSSVLKSPKRASSLTGRSWNLGEALVQGEVVSNGVLPVARTVHLVIGMLLGHGGVDFR